MEARHFNVTLVEAEKAIDETGTIYNVTNKRRDQSNMKPANALWSFLIASERHPTRPLHHKSMLLRLPVSSRGHNGHQQRTK